MKFNVINLETGWRVPEGYHIIEAYAKGNTIVVPIMDIPGNEAHLHDCDWEGCGSLDHVVRFAVDIKYAGRAIPVIEANADYGCECNNSQYPLGPCLNCGGLIPCTD